MEITISRTLGELEGEVIIPPSKSVSHRLLFCAGLSCGESRITRLLDSEDTNATLRVLEALSCSAVKADNGDIIVTGSNAPLPVARQPSSLAATTYSDKEGVITSSQPDDEAITVDCGESGSTLRFAIPLLSLTNKTVMLKGAGRLMARPQSVYKEIFDEAGLTFLQDSEKITINGSLRAGKYLIRGDVSSQFVTGLLLALPLLSGDSLLEITQPFESRSYAALTIGVMQSFGVHTEWLPNSDSMVRIFVPGAQQYSPCDMTVEGDYSQLAFFGVAAAINGKICCKGVQADSLQGDKVILEILSRFGANVEVTKDSVTISHGKLHGCEVDLADCPDLGPVLMVLASFAEGETRIYNAGRLRAKESDRLAAMEEELTKLSVDLNIEGDSMIIRGRRALLEAVTVSAHNDHRIAMSMAVFGRCAEAPVTISGAQCVAKSYPGFFEDLKGI